MLNTIFQQHVILYVLGGITAINVIVRCMLGVTYGRMIRSSEEMVTTKNRLLKVLCLKFETCYKLQIGVTNVDTFVDKYVYKHKIMGIYMFSWENFCGQLFLVEMILSLVGGMLALFYGLAQFSVLSTIIGGFAGCAIMLLFDGIVNLQMKKELLKVNVKDYLENYFKPRLENEYLHQDELREYQRMYFQPEKREDPRNLIEMAAVTEEPVPQITFEFTKQEQKVIEEVLREYLI